MISNAIHFANIHLFWSLLIFFSLSILPFLIFLFLLKIKLQKYKIRNSNYEFSTLIHEFKGTVSTFLIFWGLLLTLGYLNELGFTQLYLKWDQKGIFYFLFTVIFLIFSHDFYFYWTHISMHRFNFLWKAHQFHHASVLPTPLSTFSFHPIEGFIQMSFFLWVSLLLPVSLEALYIFYIFMYLANSFGHLAYEFYPTKLYHWPGTRWFNAALHHSLHHTEKNYNFGIYYLHWDIIGKTLHPEYFKKYHALKKVDGPSNLPKSFLQK